MSTGQYIIGIDLGTTNTVVSFAEKSEQATIKLLAIHQMVEEGATGTELSLPSVAFVESGLPGDPKSDLPWSNEGLIVGKLARQLSATRSESCIHSAKSWLSYSGIDRSTRCLPWGSSESHRKYSPLEISSQFLAQVVGSWSQQFPKHPIAKQEVILTVPASFDDTARRLTVEAARKAGLTGSLYLLEEPQAAFYDQLEMNRSRFESGDTILVVDVGGGTTDLTLIESQGAQSGTAEGFKRIAVGPHLLLGGDNMDLLLAYEAERRIIGRNGSLNSKLMSQLVSNCRNMKESAFVAGDNDEFTVSLPSRGSRLIQGTRNCRFSRSEVIGLLTEAFVPSCQFDELADKSRGLALSALGLPYEQEPVLTKHIASFLKKHSQYAFPRHVLFNGGVFRGTPIRDALFSAIENWGTALGISTQILPEGDLDRSVSRGATRYGLARHNFGERIGGGIAHNYFLSVEKRNKKGKRKGQSSICILPKGTPNTTTLKLPDQTFSLIAGRPIRMKVKCGGVKRVDLGASSLIEETEFITLPPVTTVVEAHEDSQHVPVTLSACMSELGLLELRAHAIDRDKTFQFEFDSSAVSLPENGYPLDDARLEPPRGMDEVEHLLLRIFGKPDPTADPKEIRRLFKLLETHVGSPRES
ncbi:MAG: Hsp70 family protein, partial [Bradymonadia bacterium]